MNEPGAQWLQGEPAMIDAGAALAARLAPTDLVVVAGDLGAGKTTLVRGILRGLGHEGPVPSPTFTLLEPYRINGVDVIHADLYRLKDPDELEMLGMRDYLGACLCLVEWPERAGGWLPEPDWRIDLSGSGEAGRSLRLTERG